MLYTFVYDKNFFRYVYTFGKKSLDIYAIYNTTILLYCERCIIQGCFENLCRILNFLNILTNILHMISIQISVNENFYDLLFVRILF